MEKPVEYVDKSAVLDAIANVQLEVGNEPIVINIVQEVMMQLAPQIQKAVAALPAVDAEPVIHAEWQRVDEKSLDDVCEVFHTGKVIFMCTHCRYANKDYKPYFLRCPNCGAHMRKAAENGEAD